MGTELHYTIINFFEKRMAEHSNVEYFERLDVQDEYVYLIKRIKFNDHIRVWLSDAYLFTETDYYNKPREIVAGDFILIARPEATNAWDPSTQRQKLQLEKCVNLRAR